MKNKTAIALLLTMGISSSVLAASAALPPSIAKGTGISRISEDHSIQFVSMELLPATAPAPGKWATTSGSIAIAARGAQASSPSHPVVVGVNLYYSESSSDLHDGELVGEFRKIPYSQAKTPGAPVVYTLSLDDRNIFPDGLKPGFYRAEALVGRQILFDTRTGSIPLPGNPEPFITAGAALDFYVQELFSSTVSTVEGKITVTSRLVMNNPKLAGQARAVAGQILGQHVRTIRNWVAAANAPVSGFAKKVDLTVSEAPIANNPMGVDFSFKGQVYENAPGVTDGYKGIMANGNKTIPVPGGTFVLSTKSSIAFNQQ